MLLLYSPAVVSLLKTSTERPLMISLSRGHCRRVIKCKQDSGSNLYVQGVRHTLPKLVKQVFASAKQLLSCLTQAFKPC